MKLSMKTGVLVKHAYGYGNGNGDKEMEAKKWMVADSIIIIIMSYGHRF